MNALPSYDVMVFHSQVIKGWPTKSFTSFDGEEAYDYLISALTAVVKQHGGFTKVGVKFHRDGTELAGTLSMDADDALDAFQSMRGHVLNYVH